MQALGHRTAKAPVARKPVASAGRRRPASSHLRVRAESSSSSESSEAKSSSSSGGASGGSSATKEAKPDAKSFEPPALDPNTPSPIFGGSTGGLMRKAQTEEFYVITWEAKQEALFEMPTGGTAQMREGPNLLKLARKEQCLALLQQLRTKYKTTGQIYRIFPSGEVQYLHPKDGVFPEKANKGREMNNANMRTIGANPEQSQVKFTGKEPYEKDVTPQKDTREPQQ